MAASPRIAVWAKSLPSLEHPERNEDLYWSAQNNMAHAVIDGMGGARRVVNGREIGGEHAAAELGRVLSERLENLPATLTVNQARQLLAAVVAEGNDRIYNRVNLAGKIPPEQVPPGKSIEEVSAGAVMTTVIFCEGGHRAVIGQNGDTRAYLYSASELILLTEDEDAVMLDVLNGQLSADAGDALQEEMDTFDGRDISKLSVPARSYFLRRNLLFGQLGDTPAARPPETSVIQLQSGDMLALMSDGIYANLTTAEIAEGLRSADPVSALVSRANAFSALPSLPNPNDAAAPYNYRAHEDDATALIIQLNW